MGEVKKGDVVQLKSGGPAMTVRWVQQENGNEESYCEWFDKAEQKGGRFFTSSLKIVG